MVNKLMKTDWGRNPTLHFRVLKPFWKYRIPTRTSGGTKLGGVAREEPRLEFESYDKGDIVCNRLKDLCPETGWCMWLVSGNQFPISGYELHALCSTKSIEEIVPI